MLIDYNIGVNPFWIEGIILRTEVLYPLLICPKFRKEVDIMRKVVVNFRFKDMKDEFLKEGFSIHDIKEHLNKSIPQNFISRYEQKAFKNSFKYIFTWDVVKNTEDILYAVLVCIDKFELKDGVWSIVDDGIPIKVLSEQRKKLIEKNLL